ncbi:MAG: cell shape determination protein CcmA [Spirochaetaceae bacterium]|nr:MAG: cell shape determination protein CcmA [Spirochaetaceae bacterium]
MSDLRVRQIEESEMETVLAEDVEFEGELSFSDGLVIKGSLEGRIESKGDVYVNPGARVNATIFAGRISVKGSLMGEVHAAERIELFSGSELDGSVFAPDLIVQSGCRLNGNCSMPPLERRAERT